MRFLSAIILTILATAQAPLAYADETEAFEEEYSQLTTAEALRLVDLTMAHCINRPDRVYEQCEGKLINLLMQARNDEKIRNLLARR